MPTSQAAAYQGQPRVVVISTMPLPVGRRTVERIFRADSAAAAAEWVVALRSHCAVPMAPNGAAAGLPGAAAGSAGSGAEGWAGGEADGNGEGREEGKGGEEGEGEDAELFSVRQFCLTAAIGAGSLRAAVEAAMLDQGFDSLGALSAMQPDDCRAVAESARRRRADRGALSCCHPPPALWCQVGMHTQPGSHVASSTSSSAPVSAHRTTAGP